MPTVSTGKHYLCHGLWNLIRTCELISIPDRTTTLPKVGSSDAGAARDRRNQGVRVVPPDALDHNTPQTPGMIRATGVNRDRAGSEKLWCGGGHDSARRQDRAPSSRRARE